MADPLEGLLDPPAPPATPPAPPPTDPAQPAGVTPEQAAALLKANEDLQRQLQMQGQSLNDMRAYMAQLAPQQPPQMEEPPVGIDQFFADPNAATERIVQEQLARQVQPQANEINAKLGRMALNGFIASKASDPFYEAVAPLFMQNMQGVSMDQLGAAPDSAVQQMLTVGWNAAVGVYVQQRRKDAPPAPPANLGGGGGSSAGLGANGKKSLAQVDPTAFAWAQKAGLSEEDMQAIADSASEAGN